MFEQRISHGTKKTGLINIRPVTDRKQITGVEPASSAWEANVLPMNHICTHQPERVPPGKSNV